LEATGTEPWPSPAFTVMALLLLLQKKMPLRASQEWQHQQQF
jgi:hypothetical protein